MTNIFKMREKSTTIEFETLKLRKTTNCSFNIVNITSLWKDSAFQLKKL